MNPKSNLPNFLANASPAACQLFVAGCVERASGTFFWGADLESDRAQDADFYLSALDALWSESSLPESGTERESMLERIYQFPELAQEEEPAGVGAYMSDALSALYYAYSYLSTHDKSWVSHCSACLMDSAFFLDQASRSGGVTKESEEKEQAENIALLTGDGAPDNGIVQRMRDRSRAVSRQRVALLQRLNLA